MEGPATELPLHGILIDTVHGVLKVPPEKLLRLILKQLIRLWQWEKS